MNPTKEFVKSSRAKLKLTQVALAEKINKTQGDIAKYETGRATPPGDVVLKIQELLLQPPEERCRA